MGDWCRIEDLRWLADKFMYVLKNEMEKDVRCVNAKEAGEVADIIKDLYEAECLYNKGLYYKSLSESVERADEEDRYGYSPEKAKVIKDHYNRMMPLSKENDNKKPHEHAMDDISNLREMWKIADVEQKRKIKAEITKLSSEMTI